jgi:hypothetical protein
MKSIAPASFISIYPPKGHPAKRAGPFITIRTSTFVELLGHAREWDAKFPALAGASRAYLLESFAFADSFCSYAAILIAVFFFAFPPNRSEAQDEPASLNAYIGAGKLSPELINHFEFAICNDDGAAVVDVFQLSKVPASILCVAVPPGWECQQWEAGAVDFASEWNPVAPGQCLGGFVVYNYDGPDWAPVHYTLGGRFSDDPDQPGAIAVGYSWGPGGGQ